MRLVSYHSEAGFRSGLLINDSVYDLQTCAISLGQALPASMLGLLNLEEEGMHQVKIIHDTILNGSEFEPLVGARLAAPVPSPPSCRDAYAFRQHVATARRNRGVDMIPEFDQYPIFYFTNHNAIFGGGDVPVENDHLQKLDFELEVAVVIGKRGRNISSKEADNYIAGFTIMNDLSARVLQMEEMKLNLGPAKGKDFATSIGPWLVTPDELAEFRVDTAFGASYDLVMKAFHNGQQISAGNMKEMTWTFAEIIERVSYGVDIFPGDVIGSGTVGSGCYLELNGTAALHARDEGLEFTPTWLQEGDIIELQIDGLGSLSNRIIASGNQESILAKKKMAHRV